jgi:hypothetical protein
VEGGDSEAQCSDEIQGKVYRAHQLMAKLTCCFHNTTAMMTRMTAAQIQTTWLILMVSPSVGVV